MGFFKPANGVVFAEKVLEDAYNKLSLNSPLRKSILKAINNLKENAFCGEQIQKDKIPKLYVHKYKINNLWWYPLGNSWRLVYSIVTPSNVELIAVIIEYFNYRDYEKRFGY